MRLSPFSENRSFLCRTRRSLAVLSLLAAAQGALFAEELPGWLNDPYFQPGAPGTAAGYYGQWHLVNQMPQAVGVNTGLDVNIAGAWNRGLTGAGVLIGIVDEGLQGNHPDLIQNFRNDYSWDFGRGSEQIGDPFRGMPTGSSENHGTSVGGVAAGRGGNGIGGTGAAPYAGVASLRMLGFSFSEEDNWATAHAAAILYQGGNDPYAADPRWNTPGWVPPVRVKNHSYGYSNGFIDEPTEVLQALKQSADHGVIHVFSAGNQRLRETAPVTAWSTQDANKSVLLSQSTVLVTAALGSDGKYSSYSSYGANVFVTAPSNSTATTYGIATIDRTGTTGYNNEGPRPEPYFTADYDYTSTFGGTSSAAPLVSGIMALGVEANPDLNIRMAQHLLARTSRVIDAGDSSSTGGWITNGAGFRFNNNYGFGLIDADAFTQMAAEVVSLSDQVVYQANAVTLANVFGDGARSFTETYQVELGDLPQEPLPLEYVSVHFTISGLQTDWDAYTGDDLVSGIGAIAGDFEAWLTSPDGTRNRLFGDDRNLPDEISSHRDSEMDTLDWTFLSYAHWGEDVEGTWTLELSNNSVNSLSLLGGTWESYQFEFGMGEMEVVPEPSSVVLLIVAAGGCMALLRKRRHSHSIA